MATTPIRSLVLMVETAANRQDAVDLVPSDGIVTRDESAAASRVWSRQQEALTSAIIEEPPQTFDDVLAVLVCLAERHDLIAGEGEDATERERRDLREMTGVALKNIIARLAGMFRPDDEITESMHASLVCNANCVAHWLPAVAPAAVEQGVS